jgi:hypothetical protein
VRLGAGLTHEQLDEAIRTAGEIPVAVGSCKRWEAGEAVPDIDAALAVCFVVGCHLDDMTAVAS